MNFLNKAKETASKVVNNTKGGSPMGNPFVNQNVANSNPINTAKPSIPASKPTVPGKPGLPGAKPPVPTAKPSIPGKPGLPGAKPPIPTKPVAVPTPAPVEEVKEEVVEQVAEVPATPVAAEPVATDNHEVANKVANSEEANKEIAEEVAKLEETKEEAEEEMSPQKKAAITRRKKAEAKKKAEAEAKANGDVNVPAETTEAFVVPATELDFADCVTAISSQFVDEEWENFKEKTITTMSEIMISNEMNKAQLHDLLAQVATLRDEVVIAHNDTKTLYESLTSKENGLIEVTKRLNGRGANAEERKVSGTLAVMNYKTKEGNNINLYELLDETRGRYNFLNTIMETIEFKKVVLLTMLSSLKSN